MFIEVALSPLFAVVVVVVAVVVGCASAHAINADERRKTLTSEDMIKNLNFKRFFKDDVKFATSVGFVRESCN